MPHRSTERCTRCAHPLTVVHLLPLRALCCIRCQMQRYGQKLARDIWVLDESQIRTHLAGAAPPPEPP